MKIMSSTFMGQPPSEISSGRSTHGSPAVTTSRPPAEAAVASRRWSCRRRSRPSCAGAAERFGDREALVDGDLRLTFAELADAVDARRAGADRLRHRARRPGRDLGAEHRGVGDRRARRATAPARWSSRSTPGSRATRRRTSSAPRRRQLLFTVTDFLDTELRRAARAARPARTSLEEIVVLRGAVPDGRVSWDEFLARGRRGRPPPTSTARADAVRPDDLCDILFTSGTTGKPKGAMLDARREHPRLRRVVRRGRAARRATATSSSTRSSTRSGSRPASSPASSRARRSSRTRCSTCRR